VVAPGATPSSHLLAGQQFALGLHFDQQADIVEVENQ
jgi:hypothetical protein